MFFLTRFPHIHITTELRPGVSAIMRKWEISQRLAVWFWGILALLLSAEFYGGLGGSARALYRPAAAEDTGAESASCAGAAAMKGGDCSCSAGTERTARLESSGAIALTFDDGPHAVCTPRLLDGLKERGVKASFFLIGQNIDGNEEIVLRMQKEGHLIGNHSQNHMQLTAESARAACEQIEYTNQKIEAITGSAPGYIRPPYGSWSEELSLLVPMSVALWNLDPLDWKYQDKDTVVRYVTERAEDGSIILLHDIYGTSVDAALEIIDILSQNGYEFVTVDELLIE